MTPRKFTVTRTVKQVWHVTAPTKDAAAYKVHDGMANLVGNDELSFEVKEGLRKPKHAGDDTNLPINLNEERWEKAEDLAWGNSGERK